MEAEPALVRMGPEHTLSFSVHGPGTHFILQWAWSTPIYQYQHSGLGPRGDQFAHSGPKPVTASKGVAISAMTERLMHSLLCFTH
jgi:hypothetical protein